MIELESGNFDETVNGNRTVMVEFWAAWCASCKGFAEQLKRMEGDYPNIVFAKANIEQMPEIAERYGIIGLPSLFCFHEGEIYARENGVLPQMRIRSMMPD